MRIWLALVLFFALALSSALLPLDRGAATSHAATAHMDGHDMTGGTLQHSQSDHQGAQHGCIGCIAPFASPALVLATVPVVAMVPPSWVPHALPSKQDGPETPPPRNA
jgi:hypothetical protein